MESPLLYNDPWKSNETTNLVTLEVDFKSNPNPQPDLEDDEDIEIIVLDVLNLSEELAKIQSERGVEVDNRVCQLAMGLEVARKLKSSFK